MSNTTNIKNLNKILIIILIILIATIIRIYPAYQYSQDPAQYQGPSVANINNIIENGYALQSSRGEVILDKLDAIKIIIANINPVQNLLITTLYQSLTFSLVILLFTKNQLKKNELSGYAIAIITAFSILAAPDIIVRLTGWDGPYAWIFYLIAFYFVLEKENNTICIFISLLILLMVPPTYFTESVFIMVILAVSFIYQAYSRKKLFNNLYILLYAVFFIAWLIYSSSNEYGFNLITNIFSYITSYISNESRVTILSNIASGSTSSVIINGILIILVSSILLYYIIIGHRYISSKLNDFINIMILSIVVMGIGFYFWMGITAIIQRIPVYTELLSIIVFSILFSAKINQNHKSILFIICILAIIISSFEYITSPYNISEKLTFSEADGSQWLMQHISKDEYIFTDLRLTAPFIANGYSTIGINDITLSPNEVNCILGQLFYNNSNPISTINMINTQNDINIKYLYFSNEYTNKFPGIQGYDYTYHAAPKNYLDKYERNNKLNIIYENVNTTIITI